MGENKTALSDQVVNALAELGHIGAGNAATSLSVMLSDKLEVTPPAVEIYGFDELTNKIGGPEATVVGILSAFEGELDAMILFVIGLEDAGKLARSVMHDESADWHTEMGISAIKEVGNIMIGSYVSSMESLTGKKFRYTPPQLCVDMAGAILDIPCIHISKVRDEVLLVDSKFTDGEKELGGYVMVFSDEHSYDRLLRDLGVGVD